MRSAWVMPLVTAALVAPSAAHAATPGKLTVHSAKGRAALFHGTVERDGRRIKRIPECRKVSCDHVRLRVKLPHGVWRKRAGGVHVAIRFVDGGPEDNLQ